MYKFFDEFILPNIGKVFFDWPWFKDIVGDDLTNAYKQVSYKLLQNKEVRLSAEPGKISFLRNGKRMKLSVRRFLTRILKLNDTLLDRGKAVNLLLSEHLPMFHYNKEVCEFIANSRLSDAELDYLTGLITNSLGRVATFQLLKGRQIAEAYESCIGGESCMTGDDSNKVGMYVDNCKKVRLAVCRIDNESARTLVWVTNRGLVCDRVYADSVRAGGLLIDKLGSYYIPCIYKTTFKEELIVEGINFTDGEIPYLDTLKYATLDSGTLTLSNRPQGKDMELISTEGVLSSGTSACSNCGEFQHGDDLYWISDDPYCSSCFSDLFGQCARCEDDCYRNGLITVNNQTYCEDCFEKMFIRCFSCNDIIRVNESYPGPDDESYCEDCLSTVFLRCSNCGEYADRSTIKKGPDGGTYCEDCFKNMFIRCFSCDEIICVNESYSGPDGGTYCSHCHKENKIKNYLTKFNL